MFILHDGEVILGKSFENNYTSTGTQVIDEIANDSWPEVDGNPVIKNLCKWDKETKSVIVLTEDEITKRQAPALLAVTDTKMPRMLEDIIDVMIEKQIAKKEDFPQTVQEMYEQKKKLREILKPIFLEPIKEQAAEPAIEIPVEIKG